MKTILICVLSIMLSACSLAPQKLTVLPVFDFVKLKDLPLSVELEVVDERGKTALLGYRNGKKEGAIEFNGALAKALGESMQQALEAQGVPMGWSGNSGIKISLHIEKFNYGTADKNWVSHIAMQGRILLKLNRTGSTLSKRFSVNRSQDVAIAPNAAFNQSYMNQLLSDLVNKAMNDPEIIEFLVR